MKMVRRPALHLPKDVAFTLNQFGKLNTFLVQARAPLVAGVESAGRR